ncbi:hypothetical protein C3747_117g57 [Trypanosoma cruzi]|uniref:UBL3-like ubiquitin domain-containing protein n=2 Tax=Trypanosoma cruzi TaxID=5693 RepID=Q4DEA8_TRYCC|nr:hypothetical protein, conserved [Trypanosoma cruzi]PBJ75169.1 hypothetical protein BCY84_11568 [Trypanosoma cruzi cruzi]EAN90860.1 hypothetical protein, conserved [Trypanosoma cruzi]KAF8304580.1 putative DUF2407 ubiquitin-like domain containing protein [Trypanosoma cruzi]PWU91463.1 hypothetical protein C4B63_43g148 [Trypanosoma cruzi]PWV06284.1 hypothetical protein C3747_117g57 [Trypanosoma cruzi]|eukprot:XP_812711.1 hypothetical protein [Trypanosoma cruzi strain CL Brener]
MSGEGAVLVRFVLSGACYPAYSGRQLQLEVPLIQENGSSTTTTDLKRQIRREWPSDLSEMQEIIKTVEMKILRTGKLLADGTPLRSVLSSTEAQECSVNVGAGAKNGDEPRSVLMHLVFQRNNTTTRREKGGDKAAPGKRKETGGSDSNCCSTM